MEWRSSGTSGARRPGSTLPSGRRVSSSTSSLHDEGLPATYHAEASGQAVIRLSLRGATCPPKLEERRRKRRSNPSFFFRHSGTPRSGGPGIHNHHREYGFRARASGAPRNDEEKESLAKATRTLRSAPPR